MTLPGTELDSAADIAGAEATAGEEGAGSEWPGRDDGAGWTAGLVEPVAIGSGDGTSGGMGVGGADLGTDAAIGGPAWVVGSAGASLRRMRDRRSRIRASMAS